jgi:hypothetical protein
LPGFVLNYFHLQWQLARRPQGVKSMKIFLINAVMLCSFFGAAGMASAKRSAPPPVAPLLYQGVKFTAPPDTQAGKIEARDLATGKKVWEKTVYLQHINPTLEEDVQWVFITSLQVKAGKLLVVTETGKKYTLDIPTEILKPSFPKP